MTKKKQSKRSAKQGARKSSSRSGVAPTLHEIPAIAPVEKQAQVPSVEVTPPGSVGVASPGSKPVETAPTAITVEAPSDAQTLSAPEPIHPSPPSPDIAAEPGSHTSIAAAVSEQLAHPSTTNNTPTPAPTSLPNAATKGFADSSQAAWFFGLPQGEAPKAEALTPVVEAPKVDAPAPVVESPKVEAPAPVVESPKVEAPAPVVESPKVEAPAPVVEAPKLTPAAPGVEAPKVEAPVVQQPQLSPQPNSLPVSQSITNDIPMPATLTPPTPEVVPPEQTGHVQKTIYDIKAMEIPTSPSISTAPSLNPQSLGSLTRSKSSSEVSRGLPGGNNEYKWRPPVDYFGASASAFSSSFSGTNPRDLSAVRGSSDAPLVSKSTHGQSASSPQAPTGQGVPSPVQPQATAQPAQLPPVQPISSTPTPKATPGPLPAQNPSTPVKVYESSTDVSALSPKMAKFVENLRERELTASGASAPTVQPTDATSVDIAPVPISPPNAPPTNAPPTNAPSLNAPFKLTPVARAAGEPAEPKVEAKKTEPVQAAAAAETSRDLDALGEALEKPQPESKAPKDKTPLAPKSSSQVNELRESIKGDSQADDWHPVAQKKATRKPDPQFAADLGELKKSDKQKPEPERHLTLEEMAAMDPELALAPQTPQQQSIRRLKTKAKGGIHAEIYIPIYVACLALGWVTEQSAAAGTFRDAGIRVDSALQLISPKSLADNFMAGENAFDDREIKLHPFNPNKPRNVMQVLLSRIQAFCSGLSAAFGRIPSAVAASSATNPLAEILILLSYLAVLSLSLMIYFKFKRSTSWIIADFILLPIGLIAASTVITPGFIAVLSMSSSLAAGFLPNTIVAFTTIAIVLCVFDMARRSFLGRKQAIVRD